MNSDIFKYCSGVYGDRRMRSFTQDLDWRSEWDEISQEHKDALVKWLNDGDIVKDSLHEKSALASHDNPFVKYLVKEKQIPEPDLEGYTKRGRKEEERRFMATEETQDFVKDKAPGILTTEYEDAKPFVEAFLSHKEQGHTLRKILHSQKLQIGFAIDELSEEHMIKFAGLHAIWRLPEEKTFEQDEQTEMKKKPQKSDKYLDKIFETTRKHPWGTGQVFLR